MVNTRKAHSKKQIMRGARKRAAPGLRAAPEPLAEAARPHRGQTSENRRINQMLIRGYDEDLENSRTEGGSFGPITDLNYILKRDLEKAMEFFGTDAGTIYICESHETLGDVLRFGFIRNMSLNIDVFDFTYSNRIIPISTDSISGYVAKTRSILSIPDVYELSGTPYGFNKSFDSSSGYRSRSMLVAPIFGSSGMLLGVIQLINKNRGGETVAFSGSDENDVKIIAKYIIGGALGEALNARNFLANMVKMARSFDPYETGAHAMRVTDIGLELAKTMNVPLYTDIHLRDPFSRGLTLHDIGKISISPKILQKNGKLTDEEFNNMKSHTEKGYEYISTEQDRIPFTIPPEIALTHHEKWDGSGYPHGKTGDDIPLAGRIAAVADVCEALASHRSYKEPWPFEKVCELIKSQRGKQFDPDVVDAFMKAKDRIHQILTRDKE